MQRFLILTFIFFFYTVSYAQSCNCDSTFQIVKYQVETNYAGWFDKTKTFDKVKFKELTAQVASNTKSITLDSLCYKEIKRYLDYFQDGHLHLNIRNQKNDSPNPDQPIVISKIQITENEILTYLRSAKTPDKVEGIWENATYKIGIIQSETTANLYNGIIIKSENKNWSPGEIKLTINKEKNNSYTLSFITGDKTELLKNKILFFKNILDATDLQLSRVYPEVKDKIPLDEYTLQNDPTNPKLSFPKNDLAIWSFPNFYPQNADIVELLLEKHKAKLETTRYWIIDLRSNDGGNVRVGNLLLPFIYTKPIIWQSEFSRLTPDNFEYWYNTYVREYIESLPKEKQDQYDSIFAITKTHFGQFGHWDNENNPADTIKYERKTNSPEKIVLLIDNNTFSSGELFAILARQSSKVIVMGEKSAGSIDYGNIVTHKTNCPNLTITFPTSRNTWLDNGISIDRDKVHPDIYIPKKIKNWIDFAYLQLRGQLKSNGK